MTSNPSIIGLTGGIASGKSTVASFLREAGVPVIDADKLGHFALAKDGEAHEPVVEAFGPEILDEGGEIDRQKLGAKVFDNADQRRMLEAITHPAIARLARKGLQMVAEREEPIAIYEAALLVETGIHEGFDALIVVSCTVAMQMERLMARNSFNKKAAAARIASQFPLEDKLEVADYIIENNGEIKETRIRTMQILDEIRDRFGGTE
ncbi:MAG: dephospho-CoA kinase [Deltaproteobacteria bacterium]|nr:dephospho-CoA kinase [Deltaproteobacteria bacterium]